MRAAHLAEMSVPRFVSHVSRLGIPVVKMDGAEASQDIDTLDEWLASSNAARGSDQDNRLMS